MNKDLELALKIKATADGLSNIRSTITELSAAGVETAEWEKSARELDGALQEVSDNQKLIDQFVNLRKSTKASADELSAAQKKAQALGKELASSEQPTRAQAKAFDSARAAVKKADAAYQSNRVAVQSLRGELKSAGIDTGSLASHQIAVNKTTADLTNRVKLLSAGLEKQSRDMKTAATAADTTVASHRKISAGVESISTQLAALQRNAIAVFGITQGTQLIADIGRLADEYSNLSARVKLAVGDGERLDQGMEDIRQTANDTGSALASVGELYVTLNRSTKELNLSQQEVADLTDTISKSFLVSGSSAQAADAAITQLAQGLQSGVLRGDEFNSVMEQSPRLAQAMTDSLGVTRGELRKMAEDGKLSTETIVRALQTQSDSIQQEYEQMPDTIGRAMQRVQNEFMVALGELDQSTGVSERVASALSGIAANMDDVINMLELAGEVATAALLRKYVPAVAAASAGMVTAARNGTLFSASMTSVAGAATTASTALGLVKAALPLISLTYVVDQTFKLAGAFNELSKASKNLKNVQTELEDSDAGLAAEYQKLSDKTGVVIRNMSDLDAALAAGTIKIDEQTNSYVSAAQAAELKAQRDLEAATAGERMAYTQQQLSERLTEVNKQLKVAVDDNSKLAGVMSGALHDALKNGEAGVAALTIGLRGAEQQGQLTSEQIQEGLSTALAGLSDEERTRFGDLIKTAMGKIEAGAKDAGVTLTQLQNLLGAINKAATDQSLSRLGVEIADLTGGISSGAETALSDLARLSGEMAATGVSGAAAARVTETAFTNAWKNVRTEADRTALLAVLKSWEDQGYLTAEAVERMTENLSDTGRAADDLDSRMEKAGITSQARLNDITESAKALYEEIKAAGKPIEDQREAWLRYAQAAMAANKNISDSEKESLQSQLELEAATLGVSDEFQRLSTAGQEANKQIAESAKEAAIATSEIGNAAQQSDRDVQAVAASLASWFQGVRAEMAEMSEAAAVAFDQKMGLDTTGVQTEIESLTASIEGMHSSINAARRDSIKLFDASGIMDWQSSVSTAANEVEILFSEQKIKYLELQNALESGDQVSQRFITSAQTALDRMNLLGNEDLSTLRSALASAQAQLDSMTDSAKNTLTSIQDQLDSLRDNQDAIDQRSYENQKAELEKQLAEAQEAGNKEAISYYREALKTLKELRSEQKKQYAEDSSSGTSTSASTTSSSGSSTKIVLQSAASGKSVEVTATAGSEADLLSILEDSGLRSA